MRVSFLHENNSGSKLPKPPAAFQRIPAQLVQRSPFLSDALDNATKHPVPLDLPFKEKDWNRWKTCALHGVRPETTEAELVLVVEGCTKLSCP